MRFFRILVATAALSGLAAPATAQAAPAPAPVKAAAAAAQRYWGATPCHGQATVVARRRVPAGMDPTSDAWATFSSALGLNNLAAPASGYRNCTISLARWRWPTVTSMSSDWELLCATVIHETGHLLGRPHDTRRGSVMAPVFDDASSLPRICRTMPRSARTR
jgi:hypothetical protein